MATPRRIGKARRRARLQRILKAIPDEAAKALREDMAAAGDAVLASAQARVPVRTGRLKAALNARQLARSFQVKVGVVGKRAARDAWYARLVEFGTRHSTAQPFLFPAWKENEARVKATIARHLGGALRKVARRS